jgi:hypothetical protein
MLPLSKQVILPVTSLLDQIKFTKFKIKFAEFSLTIFSSLFSLAGGNPAINISPKSKTFICKFMADFICPTAN